MLVKSVKRGVERFLANGEPRAGRKPRHGDDSGAGQAARHDQRPERLAERGACAICPLRRGVNAC